MGVRGVVQGRTSAYNLGNIGLATKLLTIRDLIVARTSASDCWRERGALVWVCGRTNASDATWGAGVAGSAVGHTPNLGCGDFSVKVIRHRNEIKFCGKLWGREVKIPTLCILGVDLSIS